MHFELFAFYGGPDQIMGITSGLASLLGVLLIFWHKLVASFFRIVRMFRRSSEQSPAEMPKSTSTENP